MKIKDVEIVITQGSIIVSSAEAIVNAANNHFYMGGGVAGAIKKKGGKIIEQEAVRQGPVKMGEAVLTSAGCLKAKYVIHAVTMDMSFKTNEEIIRKAAYNSLKLAQDHNIFSIAFCALGCGVGKFSYNAASKIMAQEVFRYACQVKNPSLKRIEFVLFSQGSYDIFKKNVIEYLDYMMHKLILGPYVTVDGVVKYKDSIVLIKRRNPPSGWALPGGFVDYGESVESAVVREIKEETNLDFKNISLFKVCSDPSRDPRFHTVSIVFIGWGKGELCAADDAEGAGIFTRDNLPDKIAFDHRTVIEEYFKTKIKY